MGGIPFFSRYQAAASRFFHFSHETASSVSPKTKLSVAAIIYAGLTVMPQLVPRASCQ